MTSDPHVGRRPSGSDALADRLDTVLRAVTGQGLHAASGERVEELGKLYRAAATRLAHARAHGGSARRIARLEAVVARAHAVVYGAPEREPWRRAAARFVAGMPHAVRSAGRWHLLALGLLLLGMAYGWLGASEDPDWTRSFVFPGDERSAYASRDVLLESLRYGRDEASGSKAAFAAQLWRHNTQVALFMLFLGFALLPTAILLVRTGVMLGTYSYTFHRADLASEWWAWVLPHGVPELGAVVLAAGAGLHLGATWIAPGDRTRAAALRAIRPDLTRMVALLFPMLLIAALLESFFRQSHLSDGFRHGFAAVTAVLWFTWFCCGGRRAGPADEPGARPPGIESTAPLPTAAELAQARWASR